MRAGAGKTEIVLADSYLELEDFAVIHRTLNARAFVLECQETAVFLSLELTSLPEEEVLKLKDSISEQFKIKKDFIWICVTHTFSAPHFLPDYRLKRPEQAALKEKFREEVAGAAMKAVSKAFCTLSPAKAGFGTGFCQVNQNRDVELEDGWWIGEGGMGLTDRRVSVLRFENMEGKLIALLFHYGIQSSVMDGSKLGAGGRAVTPDLAGIASNFAEKKCGEEDAVALFLLGAAGDQAPVERAVCETFVLGERIRKDKQEEGFGICERLGGQLGEAVWNISEKIRCREEEYKLEFGKIFFRVPGKEMERELGKLHPVKKMEYVPEEERKVQVEVIKLGDLAFVGVKPELNCITAAAIRYCSPFRHTLVCTMVNGAQKYMADRESYDRFTYEAMNSPFGKGAAEILTRQALGLLESMDRQQERNQV